MTATGQADREELERSKQHGGVYQPTFWWFTETAFPLIAGTFGPVANLFSVCALVWTWRVKVDDAGKVPDPAWLTVLNSCSLAMSFVANIVLLLNFARRIPYYIAQLVTVTFWYMASILLLIPVLLTHIPSVHPNPSAPTPVTITRHPFETRAIEIVSHDVAAATPTDQMAYSQAYYYAIISCTFYAVIATLLLWNFLGTYKFHAYPPSFSTLTGSQRTLMLQTMAFVLYLALGGGVFSSIQAWGFEDAIYWADYTLLTIGLGSDFPLSTATARIVAVPYITFGICFLGLVVGSVRGLVVERAKYKFSRRYLGKARQRLGRELRAAQEAELTGQPELAGEISKFWDQGPITKLLKETLGPRTLPLKIRGELLQPWHRAEFEVMRLIESAAKQRQAFISFSVAFIAFLSVWLIGALFFWVCEKKSQDWTYPTSLYFTYTTLLTVGYGDYYPTSPSGKPFFVAWSLIAVPTMTVFIGAMADTVGTIIRDASIWVGRWTVLPERNIHQSSSERSIFRRHNTVTRRKYNPLNLRTPLSNSADSKFYHLSAQIEHIKTLSPSRGIAPSVPASVVPQHNTFLYVHNHSHCPETRQYLAMELSRAVSDLSDDLGESPPRRYSWDEWVYFLELLHRRPSTDVAGDGAVTGGQSKEIDRQPPVPRATPLEHVVANSGSNSQRARRNLDQNFILNSESLEGRRQRIADQDDWTWLSDNGPLFSKLTETEWLIERVCWRLEEVLDTNSSESGGSSSYR